MVPLPVSRKRGFVVPPALLGFVLLLVVASLSCAVGRMAGPVAPGAHGKAPRSPRDGGPGMSDTHGMGTVGAGARVNP
ncbi:hypothetical protein E4099_01510 [Streptomyces palmae]|uniref:Uncharacterized protein n=1 Tax=Streptomyces palmae TaxID=1701085 RepID=A0A4Z0HGV2_9ACTN|nr:hypothetical protein [Streptomyces palmae]TGB18818.1 hypothetical protein E4099_01510 [Streptomyces palmae]